MAMDICEARGVRLTALRRQVLELLWESARPMGAYELIDSLQQRHARPVAPPTVYRTLEFLISQRFVAKIESRNAYFCCAHPERRHDCLFFLCADCGAAVELDDPRIERRLAEDAADLGFRVMRSVLEVQGICASCAEAGVA